MSRIVKPSLVRDGLIFYIDVENPNCRGDFSRPYPEPLTYLGQEITYLSQPLFFQQRYNLLASVSAYKDLINNIVLTTNAPALCSRIGIVNLFLRFNDNKYAIDLSQGIKNYFNKENCTILLWVRNRDNNNTYEDTNAFVGQLVNPLIVPDFIYITNADKEIQGINGTYQLTSTVPKPTYISVSDVRIFWSGTDNSWNIGKIVDVNRSYYKSFENVNYPWEVMNWTPAISSAEVITTTPTLSVLNYNNEFKFIGFDAYNQKEYRTTSLNRTVLSKYVDGWSIAYRTNIHGSLFYINPYTAINPWDISTWSALVSSLSTFSDVGNNLVDNYITLNGFVTDSNGPKNSYWSEIFWDDSGTNTSRNRRIIHITQPRSLRLTGNTILWPDNTSLNRVYTTTSATASDPFNSDAGGSIRNRFKKQPGGNWHIERSTNSGSTWYPWYTSNDLVTWPWQVSTWYPRVTGFNITGSFTTINGQYFSDGLVNPPNTIQQTDQGYWYYGSNDGTKIIQYREVTGGASTFTINSNYPLIDKKNFHITPIAVRDGSSNGFKYRYEITPTNYYEFDRFNGSWYLANQDGLVSIIESNINNNVKEPYNAGSWFSSTTAISAAGGGINYTPGQPFDSDTTNYINYVDTIGLGSGIIPLDERIYLDQFIVGCKRLGLWNNMICWPLINTQNTGTNTACSLGGIGLGAANGTLVNSPTWTSSGLFSNDRNKRVSTNRQLTNYTQRTFYSVAQATGFNFNNNRRKLIYASFAETVFSQYTLSCNGMALAAAQGTLAFGAQIGNANVTGETALLSSLNVKALVSQPNIDGWKTYSAVFSSRRISYFEMGQRLNSAIGSTWADSISDGTPLQLMNSPETGVFEAGMRGTMAFAADFNKALTDGELRSFDFLYRSTLGRDLPVEKPSSFNNTFLLGNPNTTLYSDYNYNNVYFETDYSIPNAESLYLIFAGDTPGQAGSTTWGYTTGWYYATIDSRFGNPSVGNLVLAFSASNPNVKWPWDVEEWLPMPGYTAFKAPTAVPIAINAPTFNRFQGLTGWSISTTSTNAILASSDNATRFPWTITQWDDTSNGTIKTVGNGLIVETLNVTQNREVSAWYWQYGSSLVDAYSADSIEQWPWNVPYSSWHAVPNTPYFNVPPPQIIRIVDTPLIVRPKQNNDYLNPSPKVSSVDNGSFLKRDNGLLGFKLTNQEPIFSYSLGPLNSEQDWYMIGLSLSGTRARLYKNLNYHTFNNMTGTFDLSAIVLGNSNVDIGQVLIYNKDLSNKEYIQTYKNFKGRYIKDNQPVGLMSEAIDTDVLEYIRKSNITSLDAQIQISNFSNEIKTLGLWENITCWPLRQDQMTPTGNIVYSLGGEGQFTGTILGGSTRSQDGLSLNTAQRIETTLQGITGENERSYFVIISNPNSPGFICGEGNSAGTGRTSSLKLAFDGIWRLQFDFWFNNITSGFVTNRALAASFDRGSYTLWSPTSNGAGTIEGVSTSQGKFFINQAHQGYTNERNNNNYAFVMRVNKRLQPAQFNKIYDIYKRTLGEGLGLA